MTNAFAVSGLTKSYQDFVLDHVSFTVPGGSIVGLIGENGAGKSTTINAALGLVGKEDGMVSILGREELDGDVKEQIGVVFDGSNYPEILSPRKLNRVMKNIYRTWDERTYFGLLKQFSLPYDKPIKQFSKGMKMKLAISAAFSHHSRLLILDEATSGLDPVVRDDILDMLMDFVQDEEHSILVSSHITSDLERIADKIVYIHNGEITYQGSKDSLTSSYCIVRGATLPPEKREHAIGIRQTVNGYECLMDLRHIGGLPSGTVTENASINDIIVYMERNDKNV